MNKYKVGVIGYGWVAGAHIAAINASSRAEVSAVLSSRPLDESEVSRRHGSAIQCFTELDAMLRSDIDVVSICSYPQDHAKQAIAAAQAGKHLIIEKPLALNLKDLRRMQQAVSKAGVKTCVCFECRYSSQFLATKAVIDRGLLGKIHYGEIDYYHGIGPWYGQFRWNTRKNAGGSSLLSAGCHALDALLLCLGSDVESVSSLATGSENKDFAKYEYPTTSITILKFRDGRVGKTASVIDCLQPYYFHVHLVGSEGSLLDNKFHSTKLGALNKAQWSELSMKLLDSGDVSDHPYQTQFQAFFEALQKGKEMPLTSLNEAVRTHEIIFAADQSAATGKPVRIQVG
ncbi:MAG TPA: Gfo/Idh/MocA family oxidoreductase [Verrucomicrobiae bacterium]|jgi:predicted dehydrogenase|nr:Gfo/Idh/MocA family oxidoreductase [Verrucomicrobiae bacterium]